MPRHPIKYLGCLVRLFVGRAIMWFYDYAAEDRLRRNRRRDGFKNFDVTGWSFPWEAENPKPDQFQDGA